MSEFTDRITSITAEVEHFDSNGKFVKHGLIYGTPKGFTGIVQEIVNKKPEGSKVEFRNFRYRTASR
ncbi:MAG TPA: hypothetical protein VI819_01760 [Patescibacteria group bacterium]|nr:hypothetical protein [Patescibacteria group bacterium]